MTEPQKERDAAQLRLAAIVIAVTGLLWILVQMLGREYGWTTEWLQLADLAAIAGFIWSLIVTWRIWRRRNA